LAASRGDSLHIPYTCLGELWRTLTERHGSGLPGEQVQLLIRRVIRLMPPLMPPQGFNEQWLRLAAQLNPAGAEIYDVQILALCLHHRVTEVWTFDRHFPKVDGIAVRNPLLP